MPDPSLLEPQVLLGVVQRLVPDQTLILLNKVRKTPSDVPHVTWEIQKGTRTMATPNVPNSEAHIVPRIGVSQQSANLVYIREKKVFQPTTMRWLKARGSLTNLQNAEQAVLREVTDLNNRVDTFYEWLLWQSLQGSITINSPDVKATVSYGFAGSHIVSAGTAWASATAPQIVANIIAWKTLLRRDAKVDATQVYSRSETLQLIVNAFSASGNNLMSDRMKDSFFASGTITGFMGLNWQPIDHTYGIRDSAGVESVNYFLPTGTLLMGDYETNNPIELVYGPSADDEAPDGHTGRFAKTWKEPDPSARQYLIEDHALPIITRPEQMIVATV
jgi:hypothetical protein